MTGHRNYVNACAFSPDGSLLASGAHGGHVKLWEAATGQEVATLTPSPNRHAGDRDIYHVYACAFSPEGKRLMAGGANGVLKIWDIETRQVISMLAAEPRCDSIISCAFRSREGRQVVALCRDGSIYSWSLETGRVLAKLSPPPVRACTEDGELLELRSEGALGLRLFRICSGEETALAEYSGPLRYGNGFWDRTLAFSPEGGLMALRCEDDKLRVWDTRSGDLMGTLQEQVSSVRACVDSPDGARIAFISNPPSVIKLWSVRSDTVDTLRGHQNGVRACVFSPDANFLASASWDWTLKLWDIAVHKEPVLEPEGPAPQSAESEQWLPPLWAWSEARGVPPPLWAWSEAREIPSGLTKPGNEPRIIVQGGIPKFEILDLNTGRRIETEGGHSWVGWHEPVVNSVAVAPDGRLFASADRDRWLKLWEVSTGKLLASFPVPGGFGGIAFNHRGTLLRCEALSGDVYVLRLVDV
jgi:WD40 repeat protein